MAIAFAVVAGGLALAVLGVGIVALSDTALERPSWLREVGFVAASAGLPLFLMGLAAALPSNRLERATVGVGSLLAAASIVAFSYWYPNAWHLTVQAPNGYAIVGYLFGLTMISAGTSACIGTHLAHVARARGEAGKLEDEGPTEPSEAEIRRDLEWAKRQGWTWGGVPENRPHAELTLEDATERLEFKGRGDRVLTEETSVEEDVQSAHSLKALQGRLNEERTSTDDDVAAQVDDLKQFKSKQQKKREEQRNSWAWRIRHPLKWLSGG